METPLERQPTEVAVGWTRTVACLATPRDWLAFDMEMSQLTSDCEAILHVVWTVLPVWQRLM